MDSGKINIFNNYLSSGVVRSLEVVHGGNSKTFLRGVKTLNTDIKNPAKEEERSFFTGKLKTIFTRPAAKKAAQAAEVAEKKKLLFDWYGRLLERDDFLYKAMKSWRDQGHSISSIIDEMVAVGRNLDDIISIERRFEQYSREMTNAGK